jgi:hypothetical protein
VDLGPGLTSVFRTNRRRWQAETGRVRALFPEVDFETSCGGVFWSSPRYISGNVTTVFVNVTIFLFLKLKIFDPW